MENSGETLRDTRTDKDRMGTTLLMTGGQLSRHASYKPLRLIHGLVLKFVFTTFT